MLATPRRLVAIVEDVTAKEPDESKVVRGPKVAAAFDADGNPTPAVKGFARSQGIEVTDLERAEVGGTEHMVVRRQEQGRPASVVLSEVVEGTVLALRSGKNMRWNDPKLAFTRPIRWVLALWGDEVVPVQASSLTSDRVTRVLRTAQEPVVSVASAEAYLETVAAAGIVLDEQVRRSQVIDGATALAAEVGGVVDVAGERSLIDQVVFLIEKPNPLLGHFDESYLALPEAVLATVMRKHQRYLPVRGQGGELLPHFVAVANGTVDTDLVRAGNEAVLRARYEDALFFYRADRQVTPSAMKERLVRLTFTEKLGSVADRATRIETLARQLAGTLGLDDERRRTLERAGELVKFDLGSQMVTEAGHLGDHLRTQVELRQDCTRWRVAPSSAPSSSRSANSPARAAIRSARSSIEPSLSVKVSRFSRACIWRRGDAAVGAVEERRVLVAGPQHRLVAGAHQFHVDRPVRHGHEHRQQRPVRPRTGR